MNLFNDLKISEGLDGYRRKARRSQLDAAFEMIHVISLARLAGSTKWEFEIKSYRERTGGASRRPFAFSRMTNLVVVSEAITPLLIVLTDEIQIRFSLRAVPESFSLTVAVGLFPIPQIVAAARLLKNGVVPAAADGTCRDATLAAAGIHQVCTGIAAGSGIAPGRGGGGGLWASLGSAGRLAESGSGAIPI